MMCGASKHPSLIEPHLKVPGFELRKPLVIGSRLDCRNNNVAANKGEVMHNQLGVRVCILNLICKSRIFITNNENQFVCIKNSFHCPQSPEKPGTRLFDRTEHGNLLTQNHFTYQACPCTSQGLMDDGPSWNQAENKASASQLRRVFLCCLALSRHLSRGPFLLMPDLSGHTTGLGFHNLLLPQVFRQLNTVWNVQEL